MTSRDTILDAIRRNRPAATELPALEHAWTNYPDRRQQLIDVLHSVGGQALVAKQDSLAEQLSALPVYASASNIVSLVPGLAAAGADVASVTSPHALADIDLAILPGEFAVAENAAVWVTDRGLPHRVLYFLCQHLVLVVPASEIVDHMHAAYQRLASLEWQFGVFISGPSKTADIEQSLVIGAHGPRSLTVCLLEG